MSDIPESTMNEAIYRMFVQELDAFTPEGRIDWPRRRQAALEICKMSGVADLVRAISAEGALSIPPPWPQTDVQPVGGGPGTIICEVRTQHSSMGRLSVRIGLDKPQGKKFDAQQIGEAIERGRYEIKRMIDSGVRNLTPR